MAYHVMNRVAGGQDLFEDGQDDAVFERVLADAREREAMRVCAYALMLAGYVGQPGDSAWKARFDPSDGRRLNRSPADGFGPLLCSNYVCRRRKSIAPATSIPNTGSGTAVTLSIPKLDAIGVVPRQPRGSPA